MEKTVSITENRTFRALYRRGKTAARRTMAVYVCKNRLKTVNRLGLTVSVKLGGAVRRNRIRRRIKEAYRLSEGRLKSGYDVVIVARSAAHSAEFSRLTDDLLSIAAELSLLEERRDD